MNCLFFINPKAGNGQGVRLAQKIEEVPPAAPISSSQVVYTQRENLKSQVFSLVRDKDLLIVCGGDGTINALLSCMAGLDKIPPIAILPIGTGNDIARATGWLESWANFGIDGIYYAIEEGRISSMSLWGVETGDHTEFSGGRYFFGYAGMGYDGLICEEVTRFSASMNFFGSAFGKRFAYAMAGLRVLVGGTIGNNRVELSVDNNPIHAGQILFCNIDSYAGGSRFVSRNADLQNRLSVFVFKGPLSYLWAIMAGRIGSYALEALSVSSETVEVELKRACYIQLDGEPLGRIDGGTRLRIVPARSIPMLTPLTDKWARERSSAMKTVESVKETSQATPATT